MNYTCYNIGNKPYIIDTSNTYEGARFHTGTKTYMLSGDYKLKQSKNIKQRKRYKKMGWLLQDCYIMINYYYKYCMKTGSLQIELKTYQPYYCIMDKVYFIRNNTLLEGRVLDTLKTHIVSKLTKELKINTTQNEVIFI